VTADSTSPYAPIGDYAMLSDAHTAALVSRSGSIDWLCLPRFDSPAVFARLLDARAGGYFEVQIAEATTVRRRYLPGTLVLETTFETSTSRAVLVDFLTVHPHATPEAPAEHVIRERLVRILTCERGTVRYRMTCVPRFDYGTIVPHLALATPRFGTAHGGADGVSLTTSGPLEIRDDGFVAEGILGQGEPFFAVLRDDPRYVPAAQAITHIQVLRWLGAARRYGEDWALHCTYDGPDGERIVRSALVLKGLTYEPSGAMVAAPTTSLPERVGGALNWDYRYAWPRDASYVLNALYALGYSEEAQAFLHWLDWTAVGRARDLQIVYGVGGERRLTESEIPGLDGYRGSRPVRVGNAAAAQFQLDVYGEILDSVLVGYERGHAFSPERWRFLTRVADYVAEHWHEPDDGIWESRGGRRHHVHSKVLCWVALDRALRIAGVRGLPCDVARWTAARDAVHAEVLARGWSPTRGAFVQAYDTEDLDAANLVIPIVGFLPPTDPRVRSTVAAIRRDLTSTEGFVYRNTMHGPLGSEGTFSICTFWLVEALVLLGETGEARALFDRVSACANDVGLFAEQIEAGTGAALGNFPQALTHIGHILAAVRLRDAERSACAGPPATASTPSPHDHRGP
jgi:GH15 family glucan-1,4-alpha-glucosidase